jgi:hypothetical protein
MGSRRIMQRMRWLASRFTIQEDAAWRMETDRNVGQQYRFEQWRSVESSPWAPGAKTIQHGAVQFHGPPMK